MIGPEQTEQDLIHPFNNFIYDIDSVKIGLLKNLSKFLQVILIIVIYPYKRLSLLDISYSRRFVCTSSYLEQRSNRPPFKQHYFKNRFDEHHCILQKAAAIAWLEVYILICVVLAS